MTTQGARTPTTQPASQPPAGGASQEDAKALEGGVDDDVEGGEGEGSEGGGEGPKDDGSNPRLAIMRRQREKRAEETGSVIENVEPDKDSNKDAVFKKPEEPAAGAAEPEGGKKPEEPAPKTEVEEPAAATLADEAIVELKVNGEAKKMTWGDAKKSLQLGIATEETLADAKEKRREADAVLLAARAAKVINGEAPAGGAKPEPTAAEKAQAVFDAARDKVRVARAEWSKANQYGTAEEITAASTAMEKAEDELENARAEKYKAPEPTPGADPFLEREGIATSKAAESYVEKFQEDQKDPLFRAAASLFLREEQIGDLTKLGAPVDDLRKLTDQELGVHHFRARSRGLVRTMDQLFTAAGEKSREELKSRATPKPGDNPRNERQSKKQDTPSQPSPASGRVPEPEAPKPQTARDAVEKMKQMRGKA